MAGTAAPWRMTFALCAALGLAACEPGALPFQRGPSGGSGADSEGGASPATSVRLVDRDVEAPEVFQITDEALWDGRPSLGGVWVASPDAQDPERVIMRNTANGKFVIGALFRRERDNPGPTLQISSDAAAALGLLAGEPGTVIVTALRREEEAAPAEEEAARPILDAAETVEGEAVPDEGASIAAAAIAAVETAPLIGEDPAPRGTAMGAADLEGIVAGGVPAADAATPAAAAPEPAAASGGLIQIGIFSVEANARRAVDTLSKAGVAAEIRNEQTQGKTFWSVVARGGKSVLDQVKSAGFADAYVLKR